MRTVAGLLLGSAVAVLAGPATASSAFAAIDVSFRQPERYTDANLRGGYGEKARAPAVDGLRQAFEQLAARYVRPEQTLSVTVVDLDLAGQFEWWHRNAYDLRFLRDATPPRIKLRYVLRQGDAVLAEADETLTDVNYLSRAGIRALADPLRYEKAMLEDWFRRRFS
jgi:phosphatidylethanolamine-binding protein (PEBP) family uncharacterized protein